MADRRAPGGRGATALLHRVGAEARRHGRDDLVHRLAEQERRLASAEIQVLVAGEYLRGKSAMVNALLGVPVCGVSAEGATVVPTMVRYGSSPSAALVLPADPDAPETPEPPGGGRGRRAGGAPEDQGPPAVRRRQVPLGDVPGYALRGIDEDGSTISAIEVAVPRELLRTGLVLVDTPGVGGGFAAAGAAATMRQLALADALVLVTDAAQELTAPEIEFLVEAVRMCPIAVCAVTKTDLYPHWRRIVELDRAHLRSAGLDLPVVPLSAPLRELAIDTGDPSLAAESGYAVLARMLTGEVRSRRRTLDVRAAATTARAALAQLTDQLAAGRVALVDPESQAERVRELRAAEVRAERLESAGALWHQLLSDEIRGLRRLAASDLVDRLRRLRREASDRIDAADPAQDWTEFEPWLHREINATLTAHHRALLAGVDRATTAVADEFDDAERGVAADLPQPGTLLPPSELDLPEPGRISRVEVGMVAARGFSLGGSVMGTVAVALHLAFPLVTLFTVPVTAALGAVFAVRSVRGVRDSHLRAARAEAQRAVGLYLDQTAQDVARVDEDLLDAVYRRLRDHFAERARDLRAGARANLIAATEAAGVHEEERAAALRAAEADLVGVTGLGAAVDGALRAWDAGQGGAR
ncbi:MAG: hypothetical protein GXX79_01505 [Actinomycetales bacterium]|nr:hypothetical protein [Actinomycetales bacterium]